MPSHSDTPGFSIVPRRPRWRSAGARAAAVALAAEPEALVEGFGKDLPLDLVVAQVVPPRFQVVFEFDVDRTATTSWAGGRPWRDVLTEAIAPLGLSFVEDGQGSLMVVRAAPRVATPEEQALAAFGEGTMAGPEEVPAWTALGGSTLRQTQVGTARHSLRTIHRWCFLQAQQALLRAALSDAVVGSAARSAGQLSRDASAAGE